MIFLVVLFAVIAVLVGLTVQPFQTVAFVALGAVFMGWTVCNGNRQVHRLRTVRDALETGQAPGVAPGRA
ncbi:hypothetical protein ABTZ78_29690 [Streptomyces bauhiniae]|uniref:hypothetical protein n=1 Tax=Streptomyces bauhiniae TaxID=2340725 RepID=UPI00331DB0F3